MSISGYPLYRIAHSIPWVKNQGYKIWQWYAGGNALDCPLEPFTQEFWHQKRDARLAYGLHLPQINVLYGGDLLIFVTQRLDWSIQKDFGGLASRQKNDIYNRILEINYMHVTVVRTWSPRQRVEFFQKCERSFAETLTPKQNASGEYYREVAAGSNDAQILKPTEQGSVLCPKCRRNILFGDGLWVVGKQIAEDGLLLVSAICEYCGALSEIELAETNDQYRELITQMEKP